MLVLSRRVGEKLVIGNGVIVEVLSVSGEGVRLGFVAPRETSIHRYEVFEEIERANRAAAAASMTETQRAVGDFAARLRGDKEEHQTAHLSNNTRHATGE